MGTNENWDPSAQAAQSMFPPTQFEQEPVDPYAGMSPLQQAQDVGVLNAPPSPSWEEQLSQASSSFQMPSKEDMTSLMGAQASPSKGGNSKFMNSLAPILAGAAAILGHSQPYGSSSPLGPVLSGLGKGYTDYLTTNAKEKRDLKMRSDNSTVDLAHKYMAEMPGDVDPAQYPRLAELAHNMREKLVGGGISSPKEAQEFILEYTKYKEDIAKYKQDREHQEAVAKAQAPFEAFQGAFQGAGASPDATLSALMREKGGLVEDPQNPGRYIDPTTLNARMNAEAALNRRHAQDAAATERNNATIAARAEQGDKNRRTQEGIAATYEKGRNERAKLRGTKDTTSKDYDAAYAKASAHARALDAKRPISDPKQLKIDTYDYLFNSGHLVPIQGKDGKVGYYIGNGQVTTDKAKALKLSKGALAMTPPPVVDTMNDDEDEDDE